MGLPFDDTGGQARGLNLGFVEFFNSLNCHGTPGSPTVGHDRSAAAEDVEFEASQFLSWEVERSRNVPGLIFIPRSQVHECKGVDQKVFVEVLKRDILKEMGIVLRAELKFTHFGEKGDRHSVDRVQQLKNLYRVDSAKNRSAHLSLLYEMTGTKAL